MEWKDINYWNQNSYGSALKVKRSALIAVGVVACIVTPFTNWAIPILPRVIKKDWRIRY